MQYVRCSTVMRIHHQALQVAAVHVVVLMMLHAVNAVMASMAALRQVK